MAMGPNVLNLLMGCLVILASVSDIATKTIPNWITLSGMATAVMVHTAMRGAEGCLFSLGGIAVGISLLLPVYVFGGIGAGDVKLLGAIGGIVAGIAIATHSETAKFSSPTRYLPLSRPAIFGPSVPRPVASSSKKARCAGSGKCSLKPLR